MRRFLVVLAGCTAAVDVPRDLAKLDDAALAALAAAARAEQARRRGAAGGPVFAYAHKQTFATSDPAGAAVFLRDHVGGTSNVPMTNTSHTCADGSLSGYTHVVDFPGTPDQPRGFTVHFVYNPHKPPFAGGVVPGTDVDAYTLGERVEAFRRGRFDAGDASDAMGSYGRRLPVFTPLLCEAAPGLYAMKPQEQRLRSGMLQWLNLAGVYPPLSAA